MQSAAPLAYMKPRKNVSVPIIAQHAHGMHNFEEDVDLNVFVLDFKELKNAEKTMGAGDPFFCSSCKSCLNKFSKILSQKEYQEEFLKSEEKVQGLRVKEEVQGLGVKKEEVPVKLVEIPKGGSGWVCEFCGTHNILMIEKEQIPTKVDMVYMIESCNQKMELQSENTPTLVFCIDNSGSMNSTTEITGKVDLKHGLSQEEIAMLKQFMEPGDELQLNNISGKTFVSRKQCVMAAIEGQLKETLKSDPSKRVGLVTFNNEVVVFGDCSQDPVNILGDKLQKKDKIVEDVSPLRIEKPLKESYDKLLNNLNKIEASGATALGPAILAAVELASKGKAGSTVVICTDGLSNIGIGNFEGPIEETKEFYHTLAEKAKAHNLSVNIVSIKGEGCKLETLSVLAKETNGNVSVVNPEEIETKFANFLKDEVIATNVEVKILLHKGVEFRNEFPENIHANGTLLIKNLVNANVKSKVSFEYQLRTEEDLKELGVDVTKLKMLPFQAQILYTTTEGHRFIRVVTSSLKTSTSIKEVEDKASKINVVHDRMGQQTALMVEQKRLLSFDVYNNKYMDYMQKVVHNEDNIHQLQMEDTTEKWATTKNAKVMRAGHNLKRKEQIKHESVELKTESAIKKLQQEKKKIEMEEDEDMGGLYDNF